MTIESTNSYRIALISATPAAIGPAVSGLKEGFAEAEAWNLLDDTLLPDADAAGGVTPNLHRRMERLIGHALTEGADGVLLTCSMYGAVATGTTADVPVLAPDEAAFVKLLGGTYARILVLASLRNALDDTSARLETAARDNGTSVSVTRAFAPDAFEAAKSGDTAALARSLIATSRDVGGRYDVVFLAQYSLAPAALALEHEIGIPVVTGPHAAAEMLRSRLTSMGKEDR